MGLKGAGPYFQYHMANTIFPELIYKVLEVYLDDIICDYTIIIYDI